MRNVKDLKDVQIVLNELLDWKQLLETKANNMRGLQIKNLGAAQLATDATTLQDVEDLISEVKGKIDQQLRSISLSLQKMNAEIAAGGGGGGGSWGSITGTLSSQTDLQSSLDAKLDDSQLDTDSTMAANSDTKIASQKATKTALATKPTAALDTDGTLAANSDANVASQKAVKTYVDANAGGASPLTTKGDLFVYSTTDDRLAVGVNNSVPIADSAATAGIRWAAVTNIPDIPPSSPGSLDDEFTAGSLDTATRWTWINQSSATATLSNSYLKLLDPSHASDNKRIIVQTCPATPWEVTAKVALMGNISNYLQGGLVVRDSGGKIHIFGPDHNGGARLGVINYTSPTAFSSGPASIAIAVDGNPFYIRIKDDGTNLIFSWSIFGEFFYTLYTVARGSFLSTGPATVGLCVDSNSSSGDAWLICDWFRRTV